MWCKVKARISVQSKNSHKWKCMRGATSFSIRLSHLLGTANDHPPGRETVGSWSKKEEKYTLPLLKYF